MADIDDRLAELTKADTARAVALEENARSLNEQRLDINKEADEVLGNLRTIRNSSFAESLLNDLIGGPETSRVVQTRRLQQLQIRAGNAAAAKQAADDLANARVRTAAVPVQQELRLREIKKKEAETASAKVSLTRRTRASKVEAVNKTVFDIPFESLPAAEKNPEFFNLVKADIPEIRARLRAETATKRTDAAAIRKDDADILNTEIHKLDPKDLKAATVDDEILLSLGFELSDKQALVAVQNGLDTIERQAEIQQFKLNAAKTQAELLAIKSDPVVSKIAANSISNISLIDDMLATVETGGLIGIPTASGRILNVTATALIERRAELMKLRRATSARTSKQRSLAGSLDTELLAASSSARTALRLSPLVDDPGLKQLQIEIQQISNDRNIGLEVTTETLARVRQLSADVDKQVEAALKGVPKEVAQIMREFAATGNVSLNSAQAAVGSAVGNADPQGLFTGTNQFMRDKIAAEIASSSGKITTGTDFTSITLKRKRKEIVDAFSPADTKIMKADALSVANQGGWGLVFTSLNLQLSALGFDRFLSSAGGGQLAAKYFALITDKTDPNVGRQKFDTGLIGSDIAAFAKKLEADTAEDGDEQVDGLEFINDSIKSVLRSEDYQNAFTQIIAPKGPNDAVLQQVFLPISEIRRANDAAILNILFQRTEEGKKQTVLDPIQRAKETGQSPALAIFRAFPNIFKSSTGAGQ